MSFRRTFMETTRQALRGSVRDFFAPLRHRTILALLAYGLASFLIYCGVRLMLDGIMFDFWLGLLLILGIARKLIPGKESE